MVWSDLFEQACHWWRGNQSSKPSRLDPRHLRAGDAETLQSQSFADLIISFRELADVDNRGLTGPANPAVALGTHGQVAGRNVSFRLVRPVAGVVYADARSFSTGLGMHGAAGTRELHSFCAAAGPDFRRHFIDSDPTGNADVT